ncbi:AAA family ATPase [Bacillus lacus]|uniref:AAA family ATPase n=1 Tax=Metabacillus lacus TaxID=1983721 RepID=A0A7X2LYC2_9BACI|nr:AAA domain-containing protein [Metabacillus lacus]MRX70762.1 AAA family ATPase [Metabacillus lacus]
MLTTKMYIKEWQEALQAEIQHLKKYGGKSFSLKNGRLLSSDKLFVYYFESSSSLHLPPGSAGKITWNTQHIPVRILSSGGKSAILETERSLGNAVGEVLLHQDPWELLDQLIQRLEEMKNSKKKRGRLKALLHPDMPAKHPDTSKNSLHEVILRSKYNPVTYIWGPPGTGKTYTLARVAANKHLKGKRVLILSHSNHAVNVLMDETAAFLIKRNKFSEGKIIRYGSEHSGSSLQHTQLMGSSLLAVEEPTLSKELQQYQEEKKGLKVDLSSSFSSRDTQKLLHLEKRAAQVIEKLRKKEIQLLQEASIIGTTLAKSASDPAIYEGEYDLVILDEASMAYVPQAGFAASLAKRTIICGDFKQLPPIAVSRSQLSYKWLQEDIFHASGVSQLVEKGSIHPHLFLLKEQRRMHPDISSFTNRHIYHSLVGDHDSVASSRKPLAQSSPFPGYASILLDTNDTGQYCLTEISSGSRYNIWHLLLSLQLIMEALRHGRESIGYLSPYRIQAELMNLLLDEFFSQNTIREKVLAATVHKFQGSERDIILFDSVDGDPQQRAGMLLTGKNSERLVNVAVTRSRGKFIHLANSGFFHKTARNHTAIRKLVEHQMQHGHQAGHDKIGSWIQHQHPKLKWFHAKNIEPVLQDLRGSSSSAVIHLPSGEDLHSTWKNCCPHLSIMKETKVPFPFIIIDESILWLGVPFQEVKGSRPPYAALRVNSPGLAEFLLKQASDSNEDV